MCIDCIHLYIIGKRLERFGEAEIVDETNGFELDFVDKTYSRFEICTL